MGTPSDGGPTAADVDKPGERVELNRGESRKARRAKRAYEVVQGAIDDAGDDDAIRLNLFSTPHQVTRSCCGGHGSMVDRGENSHL